MQCIICKKERKKFSEEHIFPESIGGSLIINSVCKSCNDKLGRNVDSHLVNNKLIEFERMNLGIAGKKGKIPNPLKKGFLSDDPSQEVHIDLFDNNFSKLYCVPNVKKKKKEDGSTEISITVDQTDEDKISNIIKKIKKRNEISAEEVKKESKREISENPKITTKFTINIFEYQRAIVKIAYELGYYCFGNEYLNDKTGEMLRKFFLDNNFKVDFSEKYPIRGQIRLIGEKQTMIPINKEYKNHHIAALFKFNNLIGCYVKIFDIFEGNIVISNTPSVYPDFDSKFIAVNPQNGQIKESTMNEEIIRTCK